MKAASLARGIERALDVFLGAAIAVMVGSMIWQVMGRYVFGHAPGWSEELARFMMLWVTMLGSAAALRSGGQLAVTSFLDCLPEAGRAWVLAFRDAVMVGATGLVVWQGFLFARLNGDQESAALEIPMSVPYAALPAGAVLILLMVVLSRVLGAPFLSQAESEEGVF